MTPASATIELVVGLGNPGPKYAATRHNAGFWFIDALAAEINARFAQEARFQGELAKLSYQGRELRLLKPMTFMNRSGQAIAAVARYFKIPASNILVAYDELDLPPGSVRLKYDGGDGGHNGMRDTIAALGSKAFWRLRIGIGHPGHKDRVLDYVLHRPGSEDQQIIDTSIAKVLAQRDSILAGEMERVMQALHTKS